MKTPLLVAGLTACLASSLQLAHAANPLEVYWVDVEGGGGTLIVTPAHESILIDTGWTGTRDAVRIQTAAAKSGITRIDYLVLTHFHLDHFGGAAELAKILPIGTVYDNGIPDHDPDGQDDARFAKLIQPYREFKAEGRRVVHPGDTLPLKQAEGTPPLVFRFLAAEQKFIAAPTDAPTNPLCRDLETRAKDDSDNKNSVVSLLQYGSFRFFDGGDLTWNQEGLLVCPVNLPGAVDVYQVDHHGMAISNNPLLIHSLAPTVAVMNNGSHKGGAVETMAALKSSPGIKSIFQMHQDLVHGESSNTSADHIANTAEKCAGDFIKLTLAEDTKSFTISIPAKNLSETFTTKP